MRFARPLALAAMLLWPAPLLAQTDGDVISQLDAMFGSADPFVEAFQAIQEAVDGGDPETVAEWVAYPISVDIDGEQMTISEAETFVEYYDSIVTEDIAEIIINQRFADLFVNADGAMFGSGEVWLTAICNNEDCSDTSVRIIAIQSVE
jgi:hypothetical protein